MEEAEEEMEVDTDPLFVLAKRPKPMHADRAEEDEETFSESGDRGEGTGDGVDLRGLLKRKRKRRDLQMRLGTCPRLVEEHR